MFIDTHAHVNFNAYKDDGDKVLDRCLKNGMQVINVGSQFSTSKRAVEYAKKFKSGVWAAVGLHPVHVKKGKFVHRDENEISETEIPTNGEIFSFEKYLPLAKEEKTVAIGEVGLDYHHFEEGDDVADLIDKQKKYFIEAIDLANYVDKPVILHCWDAYEDLFEILSGNPVTKKGVVHSFIGGHKKAKKFIELGYKIGLNGIVTYSESYDRLIREIGLENIVIETDCPYLTPKPLEKSLRNEPLFVTHVANKIAEVLGVSLEEVKKRTSENAKEIFRI